MVGLHFMVEIIFQFFILGEIFITRDRTFLIKKP
jgi:hypothetical protein